MRIEALHLLAWGPFTDVRLEFGPVGQHGPGGAVGAGLQVIYGPNEAGKSTALRAVRSLLYGIDTKTQDAHLHRYGDLRIGGRLVDEQVGALALVRRKGRGATLAAPDGSPIDEARLRPFLHGVAEPLFGSMYGLDHAALARGGEAILAGGGDLGESLFEAALGGGALSALRASLLREAEDIYTPQGRVKPLNQAIAELADQRRKAQQLVSTPEEYENQLAGIAAFEEEKRGVEEQVRRLAEEHNRLQRARRVRPDLARREALRAEREALGAVVLLPEGAAAERQREQAALRESAALAEQLAAELHAVEEERRGIQVPEGLLAEGAAIAALRDLLGSHRKAAADQGRVAGQLRQLEEDLARAVRGFGPREEGDDPATFVGEGAASPLEQAERLRPAPGIAARIHRLAGEHEKLVERVAALQRGAHTAAEQQARLDADLGALAAPRELGHLRAALEEARRAGDIEGSAREAARLCAEAERGVERALAAMGGLAPSADTAARLAVPSETTVARHDKARQQWEEQRARYEEQRARWCDKRDDNRVALDALQREGAVATEADLLAARARRDALLPLLLERPGPAARAAFEAAIAEADRLADRLRSEAGRTHQLARLLAEAAQLDETAARLDARRDALAEQELALTAAWEAGWKDSGIQPGTPDEMRAWLRQYAELVRRLDERAERRAALATLGATHERLRHALRAALGEDVVDATEVPLSTLVERAARAVAGADRDEARRAELVRASERARAEARALAHERAEAEAAMLAWKQGWSGAMRTLGLPEGALPEEAQEVLDRLRAVAARLDERLGLKKRFDGMTRDAAQFAAETARLAAAYAPDLQVDASESFSRSIEAAAEALSRRHEAAGRDAVRRDALDRAFAEKQAARASALARRARAEARLDELRAAAAAPDLTALEQAELRSRAALRIDEELRQIERRLIEQGEGASIGALASECGAQSADELAAALADVEERLGACSDERVALSEKLGRARSHLADWERPPHGTEAVAATQAALARARQHLDRYLRVRLAAVVLGRQIEAYRERFQDPLLRDASAHFRALTLGAHGGLASDFDEDGKPVLRAVRASGEKVPVDGLSEGTRSQLYLALRIASLERQARSGATVPLVVDDILVYFDDDRARAALALLGELSAHLQILFFTHHSRLVELAREAVPAARLSVLELPARTVEPRPAPALPTGRGTARPRTDD